MAAGLHLLQEALLKIGQFFSGEIQLLGDLSGSSTFLHQSPDVLHRFGLPAGLRALLGDFRPFLWTKSSGPGIATFQAAKPAQRDRCRVFGRLIFCRGRGHKGGGPLVRVFGSGTAGHRLKVAPLSAQARAYTPSQFSLFNFLTCPRIGHGAFAGLNVEGGARLPMNTNSDLRHRPPAPKKDYWKFLRMCSSFKSPAMEVPTNFSETEKLVFSAFQQPKWDYRTLPGIVSQTGVAPESVRAVITNHPEVFRKSIIPRKDGADLYTLNLPMSGVWDAWNAFRQLNADKLR